MEVEQVYGLYGKSWEGLITPEATVHPAKFSRKLIYWIVMQGLERGWWDYGDVIVDPFAGVGLGGIAAADYYLNWIGVELEPRFYEMACQNFEMHSTKWEEDECPYPLMLRGDSRQLLELIAPYVQGAISSPPYIDSIRGKDTEDKHRQRQAERYAKGEFQSTRPDIFSSEKNIGAKAMYGSTYGEEDGQIGAMKEGSPPVSVITSPPYRGLRPDGGEKPSGHIGGRQYHSGPDAYGTTQGQIGAMKEGELVVITSPPFSPANVGHRQKLQPGNVADAHSRSYTTVGQESPGNIARLGGITSPPYGNRQGNEETAGSIKEGFNETYGDSPGQIAMLTSPPYESTEVMNYYGKPPASQTSYSSRIIKSQEHRVGYSKIGGLTSPPYEGQVIRKRHNYLTDEKAIEKGLDGQHAYGIRKGKLITDAYGEGTDNIGNQKGETYWHAVAQVYSQMYDLFQTGGHAAIVVKAFVRKFKVIDLPQMTLDLLVHIGFEPVVWIDTMLVSPDRRKENKAFFKRNYENMCHHRTARNVDGYYQCKLVNAPCPFYKAPQLKTPVAPPSECGDYLSRKMMGLAIDNEVVLVVRKP